VGEATHGGDVLLSPVRTSSRMESLAHILYLMASEQYGCYYND
jgi:hypothetical protein